MRLRRVPLEVIQCRHCDKSFQASEKHLCDALLCQDCFDIRKHLRKGHPKFIHEKAEHSVFDSYGENRGSKTVVCATCGQIYEVYKLLTDKLSRSWLEDAIKIYPMLYSDGPLIGWTNDILCKNCFNKVQDGCEDEIKQMHEHETERLRKEAVFKAEEEIQHRSKEYENAVSDKAPVDPYYRK